MRRSAEVYAEHLANSATQIQINTKLAQVKRLSGDIYTTRPVKKHNLSFTPTNKSVEPCRKQEVEHK